MSATRCYFSIYSSSTTHERLSNHGINTRWRPHIGPRGKGCAEEEDCTQVCAEPKTLNLREIVLTQHAGRLRRRQHRLLQQRPRQRDRRRSSAIPSLQSPRAWTNPTNFRRKDLLPQHESRREKLLQHRRRTRNQLQRRPRPQLRGQPRRKRRQRRPSQ